MHLAIPLTHKVFNAVLGPITPGHCCGKGLPHNLLEHVLSQVEIGQKIEMLAAAAVVGFTRRMAQQSRNRIHVEIVE